MIVVDTSALMTIVLDEDGAGTVAAALESAEGLVISAVTLAEALIVATGRNVGEEMARLIEGLGVEVIDVTPADARRVAAAYRQWGKGIHPAALNFGDCFAYALAKERDLPLLYKGEDFSRTDLKAAL